MLLIKFLFFTGLFITFYSYFGYGLMLWLILRIKKFFSRSTPASDPDFLPPVTLIVAAYNEESLITKKIANTLELDYPSDKLHIIFITDGSTDSTPLLLQGVPRIQLLHQEERKGKVAAMHRAMSMVQTPIVIFSDANTLLNKTCIRHIIKHYADPAVGGVAGEKKIIQSEEDTAAGSGEGLYWKYESFLKKLDSDFYTVVGAAGELFSIRTELYEDPGANTLLDDFVISLRVCQKGFRVIYEPGAYAMETPSISMKEEQKRKIRISAGGFQSLYLLRDLLNIFKYPRLSFQYISHRVLRWTLCPLFLPIILVTNIILAINSHSLFYTIFLGAQLSFYFLAFAGWMLYVNKIKSRFLYAPYYFLFINLSLYLGFYRFLKRRQSVLWEKARR
jgi:poly-beta-1,6-N-acetyl-D-glucosamine synthase